MDFEQELKSYSNFPKYSNFLASTCTWILLYQQYNNCSIKHADKMVKKN